VECRILAEERNTALFLPDHMRVLLVNICQKHLISDHLGVFHDRFRELLSQDNVPGLRQIYRLLTRVEDGIADCCQHFEVHVRQNCLADVELATSHSSDEASAVNTSALVAKACAVLRRGEVLVKDAFHGDQAFGRALERACVSAINSNSACRYDTDAPMLLAQHVETLLLSSKFLQLEWTESCRELEDIVGLPIHLSSRLR
jgi:hypothetical protein